mmetsp:Transcript_21217/g.34270  ORF Transcript_21217/g.34270 Transcript_21217/m.34270 type:complete len:176 (-) Transcript_21217:162-689(-)
MKVKLEGKQGLEVFAETLDASLDGLDVHALKARIITCVLHNVVTSGAKRAVETNPENPVAAGLQEHISSLKCTVDKQRAEVPLMVMKQTAAHLDALKSFEGALSQISSLQKESEVSTWTCGDAHEATDVKRVLLGRCDLLPELQLRLQTATRRLGKILSEIDSQRRRDSPASLLM